LGIFLIINKTVAAKNNYRHEIIISVYFYIYFLTLFLTYFSPRNRVIEVLDNVKAAKEIKELETKDVEICEKLNANDA